MNFQLKTAAAPASENAAASSDFDRPGKFDRDATERRPNAADSSTRCLGATLFRHELTLQSCVVFTQLHNTSSLLNQVKLKHKKVKDHGENKLQIELQNKSEHSVDVVI